MRFAAFESPLFLRLDDAHPGHDVPLSVGCRPSTLSFRVILPPITTHDGDKIHANFKGPTYANAVSLAPKKTIVDQTPVVRRLISSLQCDPPPTP